MGTQCLVSIGGTDVRVIRSACMLNSGWGHWQSFNRMQSLDEPWTEEEGDSPDHPYYNSVPSKMPPPGGFLDARLKARPHTPDTAQVSLGFSSWVKDDPICIYPAQCYFWLIFHLALDTLPRRLSSTGITKNMEGRGSVWHHRELTKCLRTPVPCLRHEWKWPESEPQFHHAVVLTRGWQDSRFLFFFFF